MLLLTVIKGLESIAVQELSDKLADFSLVREERGYILIDYNGHPQKLLELRTIEDVFYVIFSEDQIDKEKGELWVIEEEIQKNSFDDAIKYHGQFYEKMKRPTYQIFAHLYGRHGFDKRDLEKQVNKSIDQKFHMWKAVRSKAHFEFDVRLFKTGQLFVSLRLTQKSFSSRNYEVIDPKNSLKPTVAAAMIAMSEPKEGDVFLDFSCGEGIILAERVKTMPAKQIIGSETSLPHKKNAEQNTETQKNVEVHEWPETALSLPAESIDVIVISQPKEGFVKEINRVLKPKGRLVILDNSDIDFGSNFELKKEKAIILLGEDFSVKSFIRN